MKIPANKPDSLSESLDNVMIAAPCNIGWDNMVGDDRVRLCAGCDKNVYNTSRMTKAEIKELLAVEGKAPCLRIYRRADGTMLTEDCPVGLRRVRDAWQRVAKVAASIWACAFSLSPSLGQNANEKAPPIIKGSQVFTEGEMLSPHTTSPGFAKTKIPKNVSTQKKKLEVFIVDGRPLVPDPRTYKSTDSTQTPIVKTIDRSAYLAFENARTAAKENRINDADNSYRQALKDLSQSVHDPKFVELVYKQYAFFLQNQKRHDEAFNVMKQLTQYQIKQSQTLEPTFLECERRTSGLDTGRKNGSKAQAK
ncbi:MAG: hypothetical protein IPP57_12280 [Candidatus Obscuribacter sp.]|nr:hypothetical protein [Candidatus Obscuribacter sp.]